MNKSQQGKLIRRLKRQVRRAKRRPMIARKPSVWTRIMAVVSAVGMGR